MNLETLPTECFNAICVNLQPSELPNLSLCSKTMANLCSDQNSDLWNLLLCHRLWTVDPSSEIPLLDEEGGVDWRSSYRTMVGAEKKYQTYLDELKRLDLNGWLQRHFIGQLGSQWNGWERRFWSWSSDTNSFAAWADETRAHCFAQFPVGPHSEARRVYDGEQIALATSKGDDRNPVTSPKPYVFTITNTSFPLLWSCDSKEQLQLWLDKISVTLHPLKHGGRTYKAPTKYLLQKPSHYKNY